MSGVSYTVLVRELTGVDADHSVYEAQFLERGTPIVTGIGAFPFDAISNAAIVARDRTRRFIDTTGELQ